MVRSSSTTANREVLRSLSGLTQRFQQVVMRRLDAHKSLGVVYDVTSILDETHTDLKYVLDAGRGCLNHIAEKEFFQRVGVTKLLEFHNWRHRISSAYFGRLFHEKKGSWFRGIYDVS